MRSLLTTAVLVTFAASGSAFAQIKKVEGASGAGLCASALEFTAGARSTAGVAKPEELANLQRGRDLFLALPNYRKGEVVAYATAWSERMQRDLGNAATAKQKSAVANEIGAIALECQKSMVREVNAARAAGVPAQPQTQPGAVQATPIPVPAQPAPTQPLTTQPLTTQPLTTQPLIINPQ